MIYAVVGGFVFVAGLQFYLSLRWNRSAVKAAELGGENKLLTGASERAFAAQLASEASATERIGRAEAVIISQKAAYRKLLDEIDDIADPATRSRISTAGIRGLLSEFSSDQGSGGDPDAGGMPPGG